MAHTLTHSLSHTHIANNARNNSIKYSIYPLTLKGGGEREREKDWGPDSVWRGDYGALCTALLLLPGVLSLTAADPAWHAQDRGGEGKGGQCHANSGRLLDFQINIQLSLPGAAIESSTNKQHTLSHPTFSLGLSH